MSIFNIMFDDAIETGMWTGMVKSMFDHGILIKDASEFLCRSSFDADTPKDKGIRKGLVETGHLRRTWWGGYRLTVPK